MIDAVDRRLLDLLQRDGTLTAQALGDALHLSPSQAARRRQRLEQTGLIEGYHARVAAGAAGLDVQAFVSVEMAVHDASAAKGFARAMEAAPEVIAAWTLTGEADYLLHVVCADLPALNALVHGTLLPHPAVARVRSRIVMEVLKSGAPLPVQSS